MQSGPRQDPLAHSLHDYVPTKHCKLQVLLHDDLCACHLQTDMHVLLVNTTQRERYGGHRLRMYVLSTMSTDPIDTCREA